MENVIMVELTKYQKQVLDLINTAIMEEYPNFLELSDEAQQNITSRAFKSWIESQRKTFEKFMNDAEFRKEYSQQVSKALYQRLTA